MLFKEQIESEIGYDHLISALEHLLKFYYSVDIYLDVGIQPEYVNIRRILGLLKLIRQGLNIESILSYFDHVYMNKLLLTSISRYLNSNLDPESEIFKVLTEYYKINMMHVFNHTRFDRAVLN